MHYNPPGAMSWRGWRLFKEEFKEQAPIRYWFDNEFDKFTNPIKWKYESICDWIRYRTYDVYHNIDTGLDPGYYGIDKLMLHTNFNMLKDFVEVEQAWTSYSWANEGILASWCEKHMPFYRMFYKFRRPDLGIKHLTWAATLDDPTLPINEQCPSQAVYARELLILYKWWTETRPGRKEIEHVDYDDQGLGTLACFDEDFDKTAADYILHTKYMDAANKQEEAWNAEDDDMLVRLIRIRRSMWT